MQYVPMTPDTSSWSSSFTALALNKPSSSSSSSSSSRLESTSQFTASALNKLSSSSSSSPPSYCGAAAAATLGLRVGLETPLRLVKSPKVFTYYGPERERETRRERARVRSRVFVRKQESLPGPGLPPG